MVLGQTSSSGASYLLDNRRARALALVVDVGGGCMDVFLSFVIFSLGEGPV